VTSSLAATDHLERRVLRLVIVFQALTALICLAYTASGTRLGPAMSALPRSYAVITVAPWALTLAGAVVAMSHSTRVLRGTSAVCALAFLLSAAALVGGTAAGIWPPSGAPWLMAQFSIGSLAAAVAAGTSAGVVTTFALFLAVTALRAANHSGGLFHLIDDARLIFLGLVGTIFAETVTAARVYDRAAARAAEAVARTARESARRAAREQMEALVHDEVFTALLLGSRGAAASAATQAGRALDLIHQAEASVDSHRSDTASLLQQIRAAAAAAPRVHVAVIADEDLGLPADVGDALVDAVRQALANAARHAVGATVTLEVEARREGVRIVVADDGPGFVPSRVPQDRMGIAVSILGRVNALPGAHASITSAPGHGTVVTLGWRPDSAAPPPVEPLALDRLHRRALLALAGFLIGQTALAAIAIAVGSDVALVATAYGAIVLGTLVLDWRHLGRPAVLNTLVTIAACWLLGALGWLPSPHSGEAADWYLDAAGLIAALLALRDRTLSALVAVVVPVAVAAAGLHHQHAELLPENALFSTPVEIVLAALAYSGVLRRIRQRTQAQAAAELADLDRRTAEATRLLTLREQGREVSALVAPVLGALAALEPESSIPARLADECRALEGNLRDRFRGGRLAQAPVADAAWQARLRGVDVVLLDDAPDRTLDEESLRGLQTWLAERLDTTPAGRFTGRILPPDRGAVASAVTEDDAALYLGP
jgi:two-component sensor histidine kinase